MSWDDFAGGFYWACGTPVLDLLSPAIASHLSLIVQIRLRSNRDDFSLSFLLRFLSPCEATDPGDKIFALYAMKMLPKMAALKRDLDAVGIVPDYTVDHESLYIRCFHNIISVTHSLDILYTIGINEHPSPSLPSWAPDLSRPNLSDEIAGNMLPLKASKYSRVSCKLDGKTIILGGMIADTIAELGETCPRPSLFEVQPTTLVGVPGSIWRTAKENSAISHAFANWDRIAMRDGPQVPNPTADLKEDAYWQVLQCHHHTDTERDAAGNPCDAAIMRQSFNAFYRRRMLTRVGYAIGQHRKFLKQLFLYLVYKYYEWSGSIFRSLLLFALWPSLSDHIFTISVLLQAAWNGYIIGHDGMDSLFQTRMNVFDKRLVRSKRGYLAIVPSLSMVGDSLVIFMGSRVPFLVRQNGDSWTMLGQSYVHGMMKGEVWDEAKCDEMKIT